MQKQLFKMSLIFIVLISILLIVFDFEERKLKALMVLSSKNKHVPEVVTITMTVCGEERSEEFLTSVKSALLFSASTDYQLKFVIFSDKEKIETIETSLKEMQKFKKFDFVLREVNFTRVANVELWKNMFLPGAAQRLFFPSLMPEVKTTIYLDFDTIFLSSPFDLFQRFALFKPSQIAGLVTNSFNQSSWYPMNSSVPFYGKTGLNSGVMLMDLEKMRNIDWESKILAIYDKYKNNLQWCDQDLINIYFHNNPDQLHEIPCEFNYRTDFCKSANKSLCEAPEGIKLVHGNRMSFRRKTLIFGYIYRTMKKVNRKSLNRVLVYNFVLTFSSILAKILAKRSSTKWN